MTFCCCLRQNAVFNLHLPTSSPPFLHPRTPYPSLYPQRALGSDELSSAHGRTTNELRRLSFSNMEHQQQQRYFYMEDYWCFCVICGFVVGSQASERPQPPDYWFDAVLFRVQPPKHHGPEPVNLSQPLNSDGRKLSCFMPRAQRAGHTPSMIQQTTSSPENTMLSMIAGRTMATHGLLSTLNALRLRLELLILEKQRPETQAQMTIMLLGLLQQT